MRYTGRHRSSAPVLRPHINDDWAKVVTVVAWLVCVGMISTLVWVAS
jgi:hypothetical protein